MHPTHTWHTLTRTLPDGDRVYAIGDIHGCDNLLADLLERIALDRQLRTIRRATLVYLGDYVGVGPKSMQVIERVQQQPKWADQVIRILGNQETLFLGALQEGVKAGAFLKNGGMETLQSYGLASGLAPLRLSAQAALFDGALAKLPADHVALLQSGVDRFALGEHFFTHGGLRPGVPLGKQTTADVQSGGSEFLEAKTDFGVLVIHGHAKVDAPEVRTNRVNLDTGAVKTGRLTCGIFEGNRVRFMTTGAATGATQPKLRALAG
jgi:serine/threonine protein phosphatase 1